MTRTKFVLGDYNDPGVTTTNANYQNPPDDFRQSGLDQETKENLRKTHFGLGDHPQNYNTTHRVHYQGKPTDMTEQEKQAQLNR